MPTLNQVAAAFRAGITANTAQATLLRQLRRGFREPEDGVSDLTEALRYVNQTLPAAVTEATWRQSLAIILPALATMPATGGGSVQQFRNNLRAFLVSVDSPPWLKLAAEATKRTNKTNVGAFDQQAGDPINALADAALVVLAASNSTPEQLATAAAVVDRWKELTPIAP